MGDSIKKKRLTVTLVVPVFNNSSTLRKLMAEIENYRLRWKRERVDIHLLFLDDGSTDSSWSILESIRNEYTKITLVKLSRNFGSHKVLMESINYIDSEIAIFMSADLQEPVDLIEQMILRFRNGHNFVVCERESREDSILTNTTSGIFYSLVRKFIVSNYPRQGFDTFLVKVDFLKQLMKSGKTSFFHILVWKSLSGPEVIRYKRRGREFGESGWTFRKRLSAASDAVLGNSVFLIRFISGIAIFFFFMGLATTTLVIYAKLSGEIAIDGFAAIIASIFLTSSLILLSLSIIGEYLARIYLNTNGEPRVVIEKVSK